MLIIFILVMTYFKGNLLFKRLHIYHFNPHHSIFDVYFIIQAIILERGINYLVPMNLTRHYFI